MAQYASHCGFYSGYNSIGGFKLGVFPIVLPFKVSIKRQEMLLDEHTFSSLDKSAIMTSFDVLNVRLELILFVRA